MLSAYRKLSIPIKLAIAAVAMLIPLGTMAFFVEIGFRYDVNIGETELAGTQCLRQAFRIQHFLANHRTIEQMRSLPASKTANLEIEATQAAKEVDDALARLAGVIDSADDQELPHVAAALGCVDLMPMQDAWDWYYSTGQKSAYLNATNAVQKLIKAIANCAQLALDPALDSQMLARATVNVLPECSLLMGKAQQQALHMIDANPINTVITINRLQREALLGGTSYFKRGLLKRLLDESAVAIAEDPHYYTESPTLTSRYGSLLSNYQKSANLLLEVIERLQKGQAAPSELFNAASRTRSAGYRLLFSAMDEMDILIQKRIDSYLWWRLLSIGLSLAGLLTAIVFLMTASGSISRGIKAVVDYTRRVAGGEYDAVPDDSDLGPRLRSMVGDTGAMVEALKDKISFLDGVLTGMTVPCFLVDREERITYANSSVLELGEIEGGIDQVIGQTLGAMVYGDPEAKTIAGQCMAENRSIKGQSLDLNTAKGNLRHIRFDVSPLVGPDGVVTGAFAVVTDLTDILEKEKSIERLAAFPQEAPDPVLSAGPDGAILYLNTAAAAMAEAAGLAPDQNFLPDGHAEIVAGCIATGNGKQGIESHAGTHVYSWTYHPLPTQDIVHMYATDITQRIRAENQLLHDAFHDTLTGLPNKALFLDRVTQAFRRARLRGTEFAVLFLDLDGFKNINDGLGHAVGDKLLAQFAWRVKKMLNSDETLARLGGDEFTILLPLVNDTEHGLQVANLIQGDLTNPFEVDGTDLFISASIGIINAPDGASDASDLLRDAETAMYHAKSLGRGRSEVFLSGMHKDASERLHLENDLKKAMENNEFVPYYQPIISLETGLITGFEALIRWEHPTQGIISPGRFIPLAEEMELIVPMGAFMLEEACKQAKVWQDQFADHRDLTMSVNMSVVQMMLPSIGDDIKATIDRTGISPDTLKIEITESGLMNNVGRASALLKDLEKMGVSLMIDDFGTGYSSLSHLHQFPFHYIKVDQSFVSTMEDKADNMEIVRSVISLAHTLGKQVVAEGVETQSQKLQLSQFGCEYVQGYFFARPLTAANAEALLSENPKW